MKIRNGFVSNSSSTSFCIVGCIYDNKELKDKELKDLDKHANSQEYIETVVGLELSRIATLDIKYSEFERLVKYKLEEVGLSSDNISIHQDGWYEG